jgi:hypothetical protein
MLLQKTDSYPAKNALIVTRHESTKFELYRAYEHDILETDPEFVPGQS